ncbi:MAG: RHS repeat-associated core domain-containing protein [Solirubrobacteraceae bacterium]
MTGTANETSTFSYDAEGDRTGVTGSNGASRAYAYNQALELTGIDKEVSYTYNGDGLRMTKTLGAATAAFTWDVAGALPSLLSDGANTYVYGPGGLPLEQVTGSSVLWLHHDQLGSTRLISDSSGHGVATYAYTPYGGVSSSSGTATTPFLFAGEYADKDSGLYYLRARYYDPATAQFLTRDPAVAATMSPYAYVAGDPLNSVDPTGLEPMPGIDAGCATVSGLLGSKVLDQNLLSIAAGMACGVTSAGQLAAGAVCTAAGAAAATVTAGIGFVAGLGCSILLDYASDAVNNFPTLAQINQAISTCQYPQGADNERVIKNAIVNQMSSLERQIPTETQGTPLYTRNKTLLKQAYLFNAFGITGP